MTEDFDFGFKRVSAFEKTKRVADVFSSVASSYDLMNDLMSGGLHRLWKKTLVDFINPQRGLTYLDCAGGTGDITFKIRERLDKAADTCTFILSDINPDMLAIGRARALDRGILSGIEFKEINVESIPLPDQSVDVITIAFGLRNVTHRAIALKEFYRVLKPEGRFFCLEFSHVPALLKPFHQAYLMHIIPKLGKWVTKNESAYQYLSESILKFPTQDALKDELSLAGFSDVRYTNLSTGIVSIHEGIKKGAST